jgi:hypothetical protein
VSVELSATSAHGILPSRRDPVLTDRMRIIGCPSLNSVSSRCRIATDLEQVTDAATCAIAVPTPTEVLRSAIRANAHVVPVTLGAARSQDSTARVMAAAVVSSDV